MSENDELKGMTTNERLFAAGLLERFDEAARARDREAMIEMLTKVGLSSPDEIADAILEKPKRYGH